MLKGITMNKALKVENSASVSEAGMGDKNRREKNRYFDLELLSLTKAIKPRIKRNASVM